MATCIIFDLDGTLADSSSCIVDAAHHVAEKFNLSPVSATQIKTMIGQPLAGMLATLYSIEGEQLQQAVSEYSLKYVHLAQTQEKVFEGVFPMLQKLRKVGFSLAIATGKSQNGANNATARLGLRDCFDSIHGILPGTPGKPDPAVLVRAMEALGTNAENCIMVGDTTFDIDLAKAVHVKTVGVAWGVHSVETLVSRNPDFLAKDVAALQQWLLMQHYNLN